MSNFTFLANQWDSIYQKAILSEERAITEAKFTAHNNRLILEEVVHNLYELECIEFPYNTSLSNLLNEPGLRGLFNYSQQESLHIIRKIGNNGAHHGRKVSSKDALISLRHLYTLLKWFAGTYSEERPELPGLFNNDLVPKLGAQARKLKDLQAAQQKSEQALKAQLEALQEQNTKLLEQSKENEISLQRYQQQQAEKRETIQQQKAERNIKVPSEYNEAETREQIIDINLKEAGWDNLRHGIELEYRVTGMPITKDNPKGNGYADYVLWDDNQKPLAIIEAKRASQSPEAGKHQAQLYANCLEQMHGQRPIIYYSNGYETKIWNDTFYSLSRLVHGFHTKSELQWMVQQQSTRKDIRQAKVNTEIAGRGYQIEAIKRVAETFVCNTNNGYRGNQREALLVMATGSGKTRTAAAFADIFVKYNWAKRILFLADRTALVSQAKKSFNEHLPNLSAIDLTQEKENDTTRLVFSTYPTMINCIDKAQSNDGRFYGIGHFDLIIVDEAHRSVYNKYKSIFDYFDAMVIGLTATPKDSIDHNTFELFGCSTDDPTFAYELNDAVAAKHLNPYKNIDIETDFLRDGIKYADLSDSEKEKYEDAFEDKVTGYMPDEIDNSAINKWLFNQSTINTVLDVLMQQGLKIEGGDQIGRTIIFAINQRHADYIVKCFEKRYPEKPSGFIQVIHNKVSHAQSLINDFCDHHTEKNPHIAVSVDMMDTGVDAPRVLNLLFFKAVRSYAKFWQMIGRGTRLCPDVFGPKQPKDHFLIFDVCKNFEYFDVNKKGSETKASKPVTQQIFESRLTLARLLNKTGDTDNISFATSLLDILHGSISKLERERFQVKMNLKHVDKYSKRKTWDNISDDDEHSIINYLSALPIPEALDETARRFDLMMLKLQIAHELELNTQSKYHGNLLTIAEGLSKKFNITEVNASRTLIEQMLVPEFYDELSQERIEGIREEIRELIKFLDRESQTPIYTNLSDTNVMVSEPKEMDITNNTGIYKKRVESYIRSHKHNTIIAKLNTNIAITKDELNHLEEILFDGDQRGNKDDYIKVYGEKPLGEFIRSIIGLSKEAADGAFADFLQSGSLRADQMTFIQQIIQHLTINGTLDKSMLFEAPFTNLNDEGITGVFEDEETFKIISIIDHINGNANIG